MFRVVLFLIWTTSEKRPPLFILFYLFSQDVDDADEVVFAGEEHENYVEKNGDYVGYVYQQVQEISSI